MEYFDMSKIGFSTGALAKGDLSRGIEVARALKISAVELSALRMRELNTLVEFVTTQDLSDFDYVSLHAPTDFEPADEPSVAQALKGIALDRHWPVILHPDAIGDFNQWRSFGPWLYVENMDKRKPSGRTVEELEQVLSCLPQAQICFDIAHARQVDSSMTEAYRILKHFRGRIRQMHFSEVGSDSRHRHISDSALRAYAEVAQHIPSNVPVILETPATAAEATLEIERVSHFLADSPMLQARVI
jgi:hypothetical protein